jgi:hypothetical protein
MVATINKPKQAKKGYTGSLSEEEIEKELSLILEHQICLECGQDHSFKNSFEDVKTSIDDFLVYFRNRISGIAISVPGGKIRI